MTSNFGDANTVVGDTSYLKRVDETSLTKDSDHSMKHHQTSRHATHSKGRSDFITLDYAVEERPFFVAIGSDGVIGALNKLDDQLLQVIEQYNGFRLLTVLHICRQEGQDFCPRKFQLIGRVERWFLAKWVSSTMGEFPNVYSSTEFIPGISGSPKVITKPGRYPRFPLRNWWARSWCGTTGRMSSCFYNYFQTSSIFYHLVSDTVIQFQGLTIVQVSQNQAAVVSDPRNHVFVIKNAGFVAYAIEGTYDVLSIVDQTHLPTTIKDKLTGIILGSTHEVKMKSKVGNGLEKEYVVATLLVSCLFSTHVMTLTICSAA